MLPTTPDLFENYIIRDQPLSQRSGGRGCQFTIFKYSVGKSRSLNAPNLYR